MAKAERLMSALGSAARTKAAKAAPSAVPMKSDGEKIPPDEPEPRLTEVATSLAANRNSRKVPTVELAAEYRLDGRVADAFDVVVAREEMESVDQHSDHCHAERMA